MSMRFRDSVVWVTGASSGIGEELAKQSHAEGAKVVLSARREDELNRVAAECNGPEETVVLPLDVTDEAAITSAAEKVLSRFGRVDVLINNAGLTQRARIIDTAMSVYRQVMEVNYFGPLALTKAVLPSMLECGKGRIVCVSSVAGKYGSPMRSGYNGAKHAVHGFFDALREETQGSGIDVTLVLPGAVKTDVSINALRGDGSKYDRMDSFLESGMSAAGCAARILTAVHLRQREVLIAEGIARRNVWLKRISPALLSWSMRRRKPFRTTVTGNRPT